MTDKPKRIVYWDSDAFLGLINGEADKINECDEVWREAQQSRFQIVTSTLTIAEVIFMKGVPKLDPAKRPIVTAFFRSGWIVMRPVTRSIAELARDVVWDNAIKPKDAIHIASAAADKIAEMHSFDGDLINKSPVNVAGFSVAITRPCGTGEIPLPLAP
ncbi:MAG TPA: PIN domain-containing protein [Candidatus Cybelea sp.]|nr:PIN domain-containing protein [Candidatus Cybelea sp.]